jgi:glutamyl-tRNA synthetase
MGGARTALFNYLFARHNDGEYILRIEDTDQARSKDEYTDVILDAFDWLGIESDEGPYYQSNRMDIYREKAQELLDKGAAYKDYSTPEEIEAAREKGMANGDKTGHTRLWRDRDDEPEDTPYTVRIKAPLRGELTIDDMVQGEVTVNAEELDDFIILRSDGTPTYNFVVVVDDALMNISHVIRGDDHLNNTFRQLYVYDALDFAPPTFGHLPLISGLSKRKGSASVQHYRDKGFLAEAVNNYIARLGWSHGDQEIFSMDELIEYFGFDHVGKSASNFDEKKFRWVNGEWMKQLEVADLAERWLSFLHDAGFDHVEADERLEAITEEMRERAKTLVDLTDESSYFFSDSVERNDDDVEKWLQPELAEMFEDIVSQLDAIDAWTGDNIESVYRGACDEYDVGLGKVAQPTRVALTGGTSSPGVFTTVALVGRETSLQRLREAIDIMKSRA